MFRNHSFLSDISPQEKWNVSNGNNFSLMFYKCSSLSNIKPIEKWDISKGDSFFSIFYNCSSSLDKRSLEKWKHLNEKFSFYEILKNYNSTGKNGSDLNNN